MKMMDKALKDHIAKQFHEIADMLDVLGENVFRVRAYRRGAETVLNTDDPTMEGLPGIGKELHAKILELVETGHCKFHAELLERVGQGVLDMLQLRGLGPKRVKLFYERLGVDSLEKLEAAADSGALAELPGMGQKSQDLIVESLRQARQAKPQRIPYAQAKPIAEALMHHMKACPGLEDMAFAGSFRREKATVGDLDLLVIGPENPEAVKAIHDHFVHYPKVIQVLAQGDTRSSVVLSNLFQVDLRVVPKESFGAALLYFTGSKQFNIEMRTEALKQGLKVNEYGLFRGESKIAGETEASMFKALGLPFVEPKERER